MKVYKIRDWAALYENNRSRTVKDLSWVPIPNRHDGENYSLIMLQKNGAEIFAAWILLLQVASRCHPRGTLMRDNQKPHSAASLAIKTRAPEKWFVSALEFLEKETDWLEIATDCHPDGSEPPPDWQSGDEEGKGMEGTEGKGKHASAPSALSEIHDAWNVMAAKSGVIPQSLHISDKRRHQINARLSDSFFSENWREAIGRIPKSPFCRGENARGWKASFDWFLQPETVQKIMEDKYSGSAAPAAPVQRSLGYIPDATGE